MDWIPTLTDREGPVYLRIVAALSADIESGRLVRGQQLPTHRELAKTLGIPWAIGVLGLLQIVVHARYFLHVALGPERREELYLMFFFGLASGPHDCRNAPALFQPPMRMI